MAVFELINGVSCREMKSFGLHVLKGRWLMVFASLLIMSVNGAAYLFGLYSNDIKTSLAYDQATLNLLSFFKDLGGNLGLISGLINDVAPPWVVLSLGSILNFFGYFMIWLAVSRHIAKPHLWQMCLFICIGANSQSFPNTGALVTCVKNFPQSRGSVIGLLKGLIGLSGAIMTQIYHAFYGNHDSKIDLILLVSWLPAAVSIACLPVIRIMKMKAVDQQEKDVKIFCSFLYMSLVLAGFIMVIIIIENKLKFTQIEYVGSASVVITFLLLPLAIVIKEEYKLWKVPPAAARALPAQLPPLPPPPPPQEAAPLVSCLSNIFKAPERGEDYSILQAIFSLDMLILFVVAACGVGGTLTAIDNLGQIGNSLGYPNHSISTFVSLVSIWNFLGRVAAGFASEFFLAKYKFPRPLMLTFVLLFACVGHLLIAFGITNSLYFASMIIGFCLGAQLPLVSAIISEIFGLKFYSTLYNVGAVSSPVGLYIFNVRVAGRLYDKEGLKQVKALGLKMEGTKGLSCSGVICYRLAFVVITAATLFGCLVSIVLVVRTREFYRGDIYKKFRVEAAEEMGIGATTAAAAGRPLPTTNQHIKSLIK